MCYVQGSVPAKYSATGILEANYLYPSWARLDEDRILILWLEQQSSSINLSGVVGKFNDDTDKLTNPFIFNNDYITTIVSDFPFNAYYQYTLIKLDDSDKNMFIFRYGNYIYLIEVKNKEEIVLVNNYNYKDNLNLKYTNEQYYADLFYVSNTSTSYTYYDISLNASTGILTLYTINLFLSSQSVGTGQNIKLSGLTNYRFLRAFKTTNNNYFIVLASPSGSVTTYVFYNITFTELFDPEGNIEILPFSFEEILRYTTTAEYNNFFCTYNNDIICITANALNSDFTNLFTFQVRDYDVDNVTISFCKEINQKVSIGGGWNVKAISLQNVILPNNIICSFDTVTNENNYFLYDITTNSVLEIKKINTNNPVIYQNDIPIVRNNIIYNLHTYTRVSNTLINVAVVEITNLIYPFVSLDNIIKNSLGLAKSDYTIGDTATVVHPTN